MEWNGRTENKMKWNGHNIMENEMDMDCLINNGMEFKEPHRNPTKMEWNEHLNGMEWNQQWNGKI